MKERVDFEQYTWLSIMPGRRNGPKYKFIQVYGLYSITWADGSRKWKEMIGKLKTVSLGMRYVDIYIYFWRQKIWGYLSPKWRLTKGWPQLRRTLVNKWQRWPVSGGQAATFPATPGIPQWFNNQSKYARRIEVAHELSIMNFIHQWWSGYGYFNAACLPAISSSDQHHVPIVDSFLGMINQASDHIEPLLS